MAWHDGYKGVHLEIASDRASPLHVLAGPGTGKTTAMMLRIARMLEDDHADPQKILAVTFTRTAARDLHRQLHALKVPGAESVKATTIHSLCFSILVKEAVFQATQRRARPLFSHEIKQLDNDLKEEFGGKKEVKKLRKAHEAAYARLQHEDPGAPQTPEDAAFNAALLDWLRYHGAMLIGELVPLTLDFLKNNPQAEDVPKFEAVLVDEYQDLNKSEQTLVERFAEGGSLSVIGDDNQSIYRFRHANPEGIRKFVETHAGTKPYVIRECKRCPPNIVKLSNTLIAHDVDVTPDVLLPLNEIPSATVHVVQHKTVEDESDAIAAFIDDYLKRNEDIRPGQVLVLSPRQLFGKEVKTALNQRGRNAMSYFWEDELESVEAAEGFSLLTLLVNPTDRAAYRSWLGAGEQDGNSHAYKRVRDHAQADNLEPMEVVRRVSAGQLKIPHLKKVLKRHELLQQRLAQVQHLAGIELVQALWPDAAATQDIRATASTIALEVEDKAELLQALTEEITQPELPDSDGDTIRVMSLHKSKGLTAQLVVVLGCVGGAIPTINKKESPAEQDASYKEQRRLFYVALTRAKHTLVLSSVLRIPLGVALRANIEPAKVVMDYGKMQRVAIMGASPFMTELGNTIPKAVSGADWRGTLNI